MVLSRIRPSRLTLLLAAAWLAVAASLGYAFDAEVTGASPLSTSPLNNGFAGTSSFYADLSGRYRVVLGDVHEAVSLAEEGYRVALVIVGPEKPFTRGEAEAVRELVEVYGGSILVGDETGFTRPLLEAVGGPVPEGRIIVEERSGGWEYMVTIECPWGSALTGLVARIDGGEPVCTARETGNTVAARAGTIVVVGDSSIFSNYLYNGEVPGLGATRELALRLAQEALGDADVVVYESSHYNYKETRLGTWMLSRLAGQLAGAAAEAASRLQGPGGLVALAVASLPWAVIIATPTVPAPQKPDRVKEIEEVLLEDLASYEGGHRRGARR